MVRDRSVGGPGANLCADRRRAGVVERVGLVDDRCDLPESMSSVRRSALRRSWAGGTGSAITACSGWSWGARRGEIGGGSWPRIGCSCQAPCRRYAARPTADPGRRAAPSSGSRSRGRRPCRAALATVCASLWNEYCFIWSPAVPRCSWARMWPGWRFMNLRIVGPDPQEAAHIVSVHSEDVH